MTGIIFLVVSASFLIGSALSVFLSKLVVVKLHLGFLSLSIPGVTQQLISDKTFDQVNFLTTFALTALLAVFNLGIALKLPKKSSELNQKVAAYFLLVWSLLLFLQTHFVTSSSLNIAIFTLLGEAAFLFLNFKYKLDFKKFLSPKNYNRTDLILCLLNGLLLGFYMLLIMNKLTTWGLLTFSAFIICPLLFILLNTAFNSKWFGRLGLSFPGPLVLAAVFAPANLLYLSSLGGVIALGWFLIQVVRYDLMRNSSLIGFIYPIVIIILVVYNPTFYIGNFDSVEEGFFLGWLEHLIRHQSLYQDVNVYHPPFLIWGLYLFSKIVGFNVLSARLFFHLLQILGGMIFYFVAKKICQTNWSVIFIMLIYLGLTSVMVRNNVEVRVGLGLLALLFAMVWLDKRRGWYLFLSGLIAGISFFTSLEVGLVTFLVCLIGVNLFLEKIKDFKLRIIQNGYFLTGSLAIVLPVGLILQTQHALGGFIAETSYYASVFAKGYFNTPIPQAISLSFFHWHIFNQYLSSEALFWELSRAVLFVSLIFLIARWVWEKSISSLEKQVFLLTMFGLILYRVPLGRSDWYHLLFVILPVLVIIGYSLNRLRINNYAAWLGAVMVFLVLVLARNYVNSSFLENEIYKFQTYGQIRDSFKSYDFPRGQGVLADTSIDTDSLNSLIKTIDTSTTSSDSIFVYPWNPEIYFFADRLNATSTDTPYAFFSPLYQSQMIIQLQQNKPVYLVYQDFSFAGMTPDSLPSVNKYIQNHYHRYQTFGRFELMIRNDTQ